MDRHAALCGAFPDVAIDAVQGYNLRGALNRHLHAPKVIIKYILTQAYFSLDFRFQFALFYSREHGRHSRSQFSPSLLPLKAA